MSESLMVVERAVVSLHQSVHSGMGSEFATPKFADLIIYEAHVGSFAGLNDHLNISTYATFADFETKLGYIRELGFNALQLLPTEQVDGIDGEGYGATNMFAPHNGYGTPAD